jgi:predicted Fe-Mo cluster-binding NifX family protein
MKIAFTSTGTTWDSMIDPRLGRTEYIVVYDEESQELSAVDNSSVKNEAHGAGTATSQRIFELKPDVLITGNGPGENASTALKHIKMKNECRVLYLKKSAYLCFSILDDNEFAKFYRAIP